MSSSSSSSFSSTSSSSSPSSSSTESSGSGGGFSPPSSTLYLLTFLATLFVLLFVSCAIVLRSFFIRRRFRQQLEAHIAAGILPPEALWNLGKRDFGEKPKLYDVGVLPSAYVGSWTSMSPISAKILSNKTTTNDEASKDTHAPQSSARRGRLSRLLPRHRRLPSEPQSESESQHSPVLPDEGEVQVAVLLAMPSPQKKHYGVPEVVIGVSQISLRADSEA